MSETNININEREEGRENEVPDEKLMLPKEVYNANWRDDVPEEAEDETKEVTSFEPYKNEQTYVSPETVSARAEDLTNVFKREKLKTFGNTVLRMYGKVA